MLRRLAVLGVIGALLAVLPAAPAAAKTVGAQAAATRTVEVHDDFFRSRSIRVKRGDLVKFVWKGINRHNAHGFRGQRFNTGTNGRVSGSKAIRIKAARGTRISYLCDFHPDTMRGSIVVSRRR